MHGSLFRLRSVRIEPRGPAGLVALLGGALAAAAYLVDSGWRPLLSTAIMLWSLLAAGRLWIHVVAFSLALRGVRVVSPRAAVEGSRFTASIVLPGLLPPGSLAVEPSLPAGLRFEGARQKLGSVEIVLSGRIGEWCLDKFTLRSTDPFSAFSFEAAASGRVCVTVLPREVAVPPVSRILGARLVEGAGRRGFGIDYYTFREYQFGDEPRMIEWRATARFRAPVVKETEETRTEEAVAVAFIGCKEDYDLEVPDSSFEKAARIAFSIVKAAVESGEKVHLYVSPHLVEKPLEVSDLRGVTEAGEAIARGAVSCSSGDSIGLPRLDRYERAVIVASRKLSIEHRIPIVTPESL